MMNPDDDPEARLRKTVQARLQPTAPADDPYSTPQAPQAQSPVPPPAPGKLNNAAPTPGAVDAPPVLPAPAPGQYTTPGTAQLPSNAASTAPPAAGQFANSQQGFLDWATQKYGADPTRGGGFVNAQAGGGLQKMAQEYAAATGNTANFLGGPSGDRVDFGQGASDALTSGGQVWNPGGGGGSAGAGGAGAGGIGGGPGGSDFQSQVRAMLMARMKKDTGSVDANDPYISEPMMAAKLEAERGQQSERNALAERAYASGDLGSNSLQQGIQQSAERNAVGLGSLKANLISKEYQSRRSDLNEAMQQALASGDAELARSMQMQIAQLDAVIKREGYGINMAQFGQLENDKTIDRGLGR